MYLKILLAIGIAASSFYVGIRFERGARAELAEAELSALREGINEAMAGVSSAWKDEAEKARIEVSQWRVRDEQDSALILSLLEGQDALRREFSEIDHEIETTGDMGTCFLSDDAVRLLRATSTAANRGEREAGD